MKRAALVGLSLGALLVLLGFLARPAEAATSDSPAAGGTCGFCNGSGADPEAPWRRLGNQPCRHCGGTGIAHAGEDRREAAVSGDLRRPLSVMEFG